MNYHARRYVLDIELDDRGVEEFDELMLSYADNFSKNFNLSAGPSPEDACYPHPLHWSAALNHPHNTTQGEHG